MGDKIILSVKHDVEILGYDDSCEEILFKYKEKILICKFNLLNSFLVLKLGLSPSEINKQLKNEIQEKARDGGKWKRAYKFEDGTTQDLDWKLIKINDNGFLMTKTIYGHPFWKKVEESNATS